MSARRSLSAICMVICVLALASTSTFSQCPWQEFAKLVASDAEVDDRFGNAVAISGDTVVVGAYLDYEGRSSYGAAYVFERHVGGPERWGQVAKLTASDAAKGDDFGYSVSISGDTVVVGAHREDNGTAFSSDTGSVYLYQRNAGGAEVWGEVAKLTASDAAADDNFGYSVSISGDFLVVGARYDDDAGSDSGSAYVFARNAGGAERWGQVAKLTASDAASDDEFGGSVSVSGDKVVVGALWNDDAGSASGSAYVFARNAGGADVWGQVAKLAASDAGAGDRFGGAVSISGDTVIVGAYLNDDVGISSGSAYVFERNAGGEDAWGEVIKLASSDLASQDHFGYSVSISGDKLLVGANYNDVAGLRAGSAYVFERNMGGAGMWGEVATLAASDPGSADFFGASASIGGDTLIVGAVLANSGGVASGSAYVSELSCVDCGDGLSESPEECDDGSGNSDTIPDACRTDCRLPWCGDLVLDTGEDCEDGNQTDNDGCDSNCRFTGCGNGVVTGPEECDDGNTVGGDGCDSICLLECYDSDGDGFGSPGTQCTGGAGPDCDDGNDQIWRTPGEVTTFFLSDLTSIIWEPPVDPGSAAVAYDVLRTPFVQYWTAWGATICVESDDEMDTMATDETIPDPGSVLYYLIRVENACPSNAYELLGNQSDDTPRTGRLCP